MPLGTNDYECLASKHACLSAKHVYSPSWIPRQEKNITLVLSYYYSYYPVSCENNIVLKILLKNTFSG